MYYIWKWQANLEGKAVKKQKADNLQSPLVSIVVKKQLKGFDQLILGAWL